MGLWQRAGPLGASQDTAQSRTDPHSAPRDPRSARQSPSRLEKHRLSVSFLHTSADPHARRTHSARLGDGCNRAHANALLDTANPAQRDANFGELLVARPDQLKVSTMECGVHGNTEQLTKLYRAQLGRTWVTGIDLQHGVPIPKLSDGEFRPGSHSS